MVKRMKEVINFKFNLNQQITNIKNTIAYLNNRNFLFQSSVTFFLVVLFYTPIFFQTYGYLNDYIVFEYQKLDCCFSIVETKQLLLLVDQHK